MIPILAICVGIVFFIGGNKLSAKKNSVQAATAFMKTFLIATCAFRELMKVGRKRSFLGPPEVSQMTTDYMDEKPSGLQIDWIASKLKIESRQLQVEFCRESNWPIWSVNHFEIADVKLDASVIAELRHHGMIPILVEQGWTKDIEPTGYLTVLAEHAFVAPVALAICRKYDLNYLFCFPAVVDIAELQTLLAAIPESQGLQRMNDKPFSSVHWALG